MQVPFPLKPRALCSARSLTRFRSLNAGPFPHSLTSLRSWQSSDNFPPRGSQDLTLLAPQVQVSHKRNKRRRATGALAQSCPFLETTLAMARRSWRGRLPSRRLHRAIARDMPISATPEALRLLRALRRPMPKTVARVALAGKRRAFPRRARPASILLPARHFLRCRLQPARLLLRLPLRPRRQRRLRWRPSRRLQRRILRVIRG